MPSSAGMLKRLTLIRPTGRKGSDMKHTPGKWYKCNTGNHQGLIISRDTGENIAVTYDKKNDGLIAAAPDLLEACRELLAEWDTKRIDETYQTGITQETYGIQLAREAIQKADVPKGE